MPAAQTEGTFRIQRFESLRAIGKLVDNWYEGIIERSKAGQKVVFQIAAPGTLLTSAMGMPTILHAHFAAYIAARKYYPQVLAAAENGGFLSDTCSYIRTSVGVWHGMLNNLPLPEEVKLPPPDLVICGGECHEQWTMAELLHKKVGCPTVILDPCPTALARFDTPEPSAEDWRRRTEFLERRLRDEVIPVIEKVAGRRYDYDRLSECLAILKECIIIRDEILEFLKHKPAPLTIFDLGAALAPIILLEGNPEAVKLYRAFRDEVEQRVVQGIAAVPGEKYRFYWDNYTMWGLLGKIMRILGPRHVNILVGRYPLTFWTDGALIEPERPLWTIADQLLRMIVNVYPSWGQWRIGKCIEEYHLDGLLMPSSPTCRLFDIGQQGIMEAAERKYGVPSLQFDADMVDPTFFRESRFVTQLESFLEVVDARRRH